MRKKGFRLLSQFGIAGAGLIEESGPFGRTTVEGRLEDRLELPIALGSHGPAGEANSRCSQAFASLALRLTVAAETPRTRAVSSMLSPSKYPCFPLWP